LSFSLSDACIVIQSGSFSLRVSCSSVFFFFNLYISQLICTHLNYLIYLISMVCYLCKHLMYKGLTTIFWRGLHRVTWTPRMNLHIFTHMIGYYLYLKNMRCFSTVKMREGVNIVISTNTFLDLICCKVIQDNNFRYVRIIRRV